MNRILVSIIVAGLFTACKQTQQSAPQGVKSYPVITVSQGQATSYFQYPANIEGKVNSPVQAKVTGYITQVLVDEGQSVTKGQPLFRLETQTLNQTAQAAKASVEAAQVEVNKLLPLVEKNIVSPVQLQTAKANLQRAQAAYSEVASNMDFATVKAPVSGVVGAINLREGALVTAGNTMLTSVSDVSEVYVYFSMNEKEYLTFLEQVPGKTTAEKLKSFPKVKLILANGATYPEEGIIQAVTGQIDASTGSIQFRAVFPNPNGLLTNGNSGIIQIPQEFTDAIVIPEVAAFEQQGLVFVYKVEKDTIKQSVVKVRNRSANTMVVENGLKAGEVIVVQGINGLRSGMVIKPEPVQMDSIIKKVQPIF
ncbi:efflux RND transporter periplasmic adaptor subunit [Capnocytophaga felis]|uniref:RND transporter n=1 Tax=Capnocytophaga felis TaxID=2267611 RepID=A0A5M4B5M3_9FLAO|nr:efflux RND transporter periplasmic adaptor subunit [Capnocytophaga felis]GET44848.1 RND transporter [Capnocytophaga felis]GET48625.1 RND transporter [Capnocytophaga felis]